MIYLVYKVYFFFEGYVDHRYRHVRTHSFPTRRSSDLAQFPHPVPDGVDYQTHADSLSRALELALLVLQSGVNLSSRRCRSTISAVSSTPSSKLGRVEGRRMVPEVSRELRSEEGRGGTMGVRTGIYRVAMYQ